MGKICFVAVNMGGGDEGEVGQWELVRTFWKWRVVSKLQTW